MPVWPDAHAGPQAGVTAMAKRKNSKKAEKIKDEDGLVPVVVAGSADEAEQFRQVLEDHDIPAVVDTDEGVTGLAEAVSDEVQPDEREQGVAVLVPEGMLEEAGTILAEREEFDVLAEEDVADEDDDDGDDVDLTDGFEEDWGDELDKEFVGDEKDMAEDLDSDDDEGFGDDDER